MKKSFPFNYDEKYVSFEIKTSEQLVRILQLHLSSCEVYC